MGQAGAEGMQRGRGGAHNLVGRRLPLAIRSSFEMAGRRVQGGELTWFALAPPYGSVVVLERGAGKKEHATTPRCRRLWFRLSGIEDSLRKQRRWRDASALDRCASPRSWSCPNKFTC